MTRILLLAATAAAALTALPAVAQTHAMPGGMKMNMPMPASKARPKAKPQPHRRAHKGTPARKTIAKHGHSRRKAMPAMNMPAMNMPGMTMPMAPKPTSPAQPAMPPMDMPAQSGRSAPPPAEMKGMAMPPEPKAAATPQASMPGMDMPAPAKAAASPSAGMAGMDMPARPGSATTSHADMPGMDEKPGALTVAGSGTSRLPASGDPGMHGLHFTPGDWMIMAHGAVWGVYTDQGGPRGDSQAYAPSMAMLSASHPLGDAGRIELRTMLSLDPLMGPRGYPNLFATGETANGVALVDRQHPHDFFMELSARVEAQVAPRVTAFLYGGPVAEPALGPSAFMHRRSARYLPLSPITHHWFDSTHVTFGVVTAGIATAGFQLEASAFRGREPDENRWDIETPSLDSWSARLTWSPNPHWTAQISHGQLHSPEAAHPGEDERRTTATVHYSGGGLSAMVGFAAKQRVPGDTLTAWIGEATWDLSKHHSLFGRIENVANDELFPNPADPLHDHKFRITRFEGGYAYRVPLGTLAELALGGSLAAYAKPAALDTVYGVHPLSYTLFAKLSLGD